MLVEFEQFGTVKQTGARSCSAVVFRIFSFV